MSNQLITLLNEAEYCSCIIFLKRLFKCNFSEQNVGNSSEKNCENMYIMV